MIPPGIAAATAARRPGGAGGGARPRPSRARRARSRAGGGGRRVRNTGRGRGGGGGGGGGAGARAWGASWGGALSVVARDGGHQGIAVAFLEAALGLAELGMEDQDLRLGRRQGVLPRGLPQAPQFRPRE